MKHPIIYIFFFLLLSLSLYSQSQDIGLDFYISNPYVAKSNSDRCNLDFIGQKLKNDHLSYDYSIFEEHLTGVSTDSYPFYLQLSHAFNCKGTHKINWDYKLYIGYFFEDETGIYFDHSEDLVNDTVLIIASDVYASSKDLHIGGRINFIMFERKYLEIYLSPDFSIGMTFSNKVYEKVYSIKTKNEDGRLIMIIPDSYRDIVNNTYRAKQCGLINIGALLGFKIPIYKKWGATIELGKIFIFEHTFNGPDILKTAALLGGGFYYRFKSI